MRIISLSFVLMIVAGCTDSDTNELFDTNAVADAQLDGKFSQEISGSDAGFEDIEILPGTFGAPCNSATDCDSGICTDTREGKRCSQLCQESCPAGFQCVENPAGRDTYFYCRSIWVTLCDPCTTNTNCNVGGSTNNVCIQGGADGNFCGIHCLPDDPTGCPDEYSCLQVNDAVTQQNVYQCVSNSQQCSCSLRAKKLSLSTSCYIQNSEGTCTGARTCMGQGLSSCSAKIPKAESCNLLDDNCNGATDDVVPGVQDCKVDNEFGSCSGQVNSCDDKGNPVCSASKPSPEKCNGIDDDCDGSTDENLCDDGNTCTTDSCNTDGSCKHQDLTETPCTDGDICTANDVCATGKCVGGDKTLCTDSNECTNDSCDPQTGCKYVAKSGGSCKDDGNACTQDICEKGSCAHPSGKDGVACESDGEVCTKDQCKGGQCEHVANTLKCDDGDKCTLNDFCKDTVCNGGPQKDCNDNNPCTIDLCELSLGCYHKPAQVGDGSPCADDGNPCTQDLCKGSQCAHLPIPGCK